MTTDAQREIERGQLIRLFDALGWELPSDYYHDNKSQAPDFIVPLDNMQVGIEVTEYQTGEYTRGGVLLRQAEGRAADIVEAARPFCKDRPHLSNVSVLLWFVDAPPRKKEHLAFLEEVSGFVLSRQDELKQQREYGSYHFKSPLLKRYVQELVLTPEQYPLWSTNFSGGWIGPPDSALTNIITTKSNKNYRGIEPLWLAIVCSHHTSTHTNPEGPQEFSSVDGLEAVLSASPFARVYVVTLFGTVFVWEKGGQWRKVERK